VSSESAFGIIDAFSRCLAVSLSMMAEAGRSIFNGSVVESFPGGAIFPRLHRFGTKNIKFIKNSFFF
jgi:hypothetical protein